MDGGMSLEAAGRKRFTGFFYLNSLITRIALLYNVEEHLYL